MTTVKQSAEQKTPSQSKKRQVITGMLISLVTLVLILGIVELVAFLWERNMAQGELGWTLVASRRMPLNLRGTEEQAYYVLEPGSEFNWEGISVKINSRGFRTDEITIPKPADTYRILNIGDSVAFGWEVEQTATYGERLENMLNDLDNGLQYEVINAGVPGWNLPMEVNFLEQEGLTYEPDMIILDLTLVNDVYPDNLAARAQKDLLSWLRDNTYTWPFLTMQMRFILARTVGPEAFRTLNPPQEASKYFPLDKNDPAWTRLWNPIESIHEIALERDIPFIIIAFPSAFQLNRNAHPDIPQQVITEKAEAAGIELIDLLPVYQEICAQATQDACEGYENLLFADVWMHPNELGHELAAQELFARH